MHAESLTKHWTKELLPLPLPPKTTMWTDVRCIMRIGKKWDDEMLFKLHFCRRNGMLPLLLMGGGGAAAPY